VHFTIVSKVAKTSDNCLYSSVLLFLVFLGLVLISGTQPLPLIILSKKFNYVSPFNLISTIQVLMMMT
jgi:hypothetical protein